MTIMQQKRGTAAEWTSNSTIVLAEGEIGVEYDTGKAKVGDGTSAWSVLPYIGGGGSSTNGLPAGGVAGDILAKIDGTDYNAEWIENFTPQVKHEVKLAESISKGQAVYVSSANGTNIIVSKASNATEATSSKTMGLLETGGVTNDIVKVVTEGLLTGLDTSTATAGDPVWLGTSGNLIYGLSNKPIAPAHLVYIGVVTRVHAVNGEIFVHLQNGFELNEIHNVLIGSGYSSTASDKDLLVYESSTSLWKNKSFSTLDLLTATAAATAYQPKDADLTAIAGISTTSGILKKTAADTWSLTADNSSNWDTAYGWGNHASAGYLTSLDADLVAIAALTGTSGLLKKTAADTWTLDTSTYLTSNQSISLSGDATGSGTTSIALTLANSGVTAGTYKSVTVDAKGRVTAGTNPTTLSDYGITDAAALSGANFTGNVNVTSATTTLDSKFLNSSGTGLRILGSQSVSGGLPGLILSPYVDTVEQTSSQFYYASNTNKWIFETDLQVVGATTSGGTIAANGGITTAQKKNSLVVSAYNSATADPNKFANDSRVIMTAAATGSSDPTTRPDGTPLVAGDIWIDW